MAMIIMGFPGIGKSTVARELKEFIDFESSYMTVDDVRHDDWYKAYCQYAISLYDQGYKVFVSTHKEVRDYMAEIKGERFVAACYPTLELKDQWIDRLQQRYQNTQSEKDRRALMSVQQWYDQMVQGMMDDDRFIQIPLTRIDYSLKARIGLVERDLNASGQYMTTVAAFKPSYAMKSIIKRVKKKAEAESAIAIANQNKNKNK